MLLKMYIPGLGRPNVKNTRKSFAGPYCELS